jgi:hypothetical protein
MLYIVISIGIPVLEICFIYVVNADGVGIHEIQIKRRKNVKFKIVLEPDKVNRIYEELERAENKGAEDLSLEISGQISKNGIFTIEQMTLYGECTTEYVTDIFKKRETI